MNDAAHTDDLQTRIRVAWLYYMEGMTQADIAQNLRLTRLRVNRLLGEARDSGLVSITINSPLQSCVQLERELVRRFGLRQAIVIPAAQNAAQTSAHVGKAVAELASRLIEERQNGIVGVGWGSTLREAIRHLRAGRYPDLAVASMMGGITYGNEINTFEIAMSFASVWQAQCHYVAAPIYAGTPKSRDMIVAQEVYEATFARIRAADIALLSAGDLTDRSLLIRYGLPNDVAVSDLVAHGAVGDLLGQFIDGNGVPIAHPINQRAISLEVQALRQIPTVVLASGGMYKGQVIAAALRAKLVSVLVTDEGAARAVLDLTAA